MSIRLCLLGTVAAAVLFGDCNSSNPASPNTPGQWTTVFEDQFNRADGPIGGNYTTQLYNTTGTVGISGDKLQIKGGQFWAVRYSGQVSYPRFRISVQCSTTTDTIGYQFAVSGKTDSSGPNWYLQEGYMAGVAPDSNQIAIERLDFTDTGIANFGAYSLVQILASKKSMKVSMSAHKWYSLSLEINGELLTTIIQDMGSGMADTLSYTDTRSGVSGNIASMNGQQPGNYSIFMKDFKIEKYQ